MDVRMYAVLSIFGLFSFEIQEDTTWVIAHRFFSDLF